MDEEENNFQVLENSDSSDSELDQAPYYGEEIKTEKSTKDESEAWVENPENNSENLTFDTEKPPSKKKLVTLRLLMHKKYGLDSLLKDSRVTELREMCDVTLKVHDITSDKQERLITVTSDSPSALVNTVQMIAQFIADDDQAKSGKTLKTGGLSRC